MAPSSALPVLDRPTTTTASTGGGVPAPAAPPATASATASATAAIPAQTATPDPAPVPAVRRSRRFPLPPGRRGPLWLAALMAGAVLAGAPSVLGTGPSPAADASAYGLGIATDLGISGDMADTDVRRGLTEAEAQVRLGELAASRAARVPRTVAPMNDYRLTTCFCMRWGQMHYGLDLAAPLGTPIYSSADGVVLRAGRASGYGNAVYIQDADGNVHVYGHMRYYDVEAGDIVHAGDQIATVGNEGFSTGPHLHYEIHRGGEGGRRLDPQEWLAERGVHI